MSGRGHIGESLTATGIRLINQHTKLYTMSTHTSPHNGVPTPMLSNQQIADIKSSINPDYKRKRIILTIAHIIVLILSLSLIVFISYDTFSNIPFLKNQTYMTFQFWVCIVFLADFVLELCYSDDKKRYIRYHWFFLLISIPYLNIINMTGIEFAPETLYYIRFIPLIRGAYALAVVVGDFSTDRAISLIAQYAVILLSIIYFSSLIFYYVEKSVNSNVNTYWDSLYWAFMNVDTVGSDITAVTVIGKIMTIVLALSGMMMLPLFTVYITAKVKEYNERHRERQAEVIHEAEKVEDGNNQS